MAGIHDSQLHSLVSSQSRFPAMSLREMYARRTNQGRGALCDQWALTDTLMMTLSELDCPHVSQKSSPGIRGESAEGRGCLTSCCVLRQRGGR